MRSADPVIVLAALLLPAAGAPPAQTSDTEKSAQQAAFTFDGKLTQGGWIRGTVPAGTTQAFLGQTPLSIDAQGRFFAAFDRDADLQSLLVAVRADGSRIETPLIVAPRDWQIERIDVARRPGGPSEDFMRIREPELARIAAARSAEAASDGWRQTFIWPAHGRISGRFGSQRIYRGEPGAYHSGIDIAPGAGAPFVAPADGVVTLAAIDPPFSLEGHLLIIDHGQGLNSAFLHCATLAVHEGEVVHQGQLLGTVGMSGRATGPHLHWSLKWHAARLDPLLFAGPMR